MTESTTDSNFEQDVIKSSKPVLVDFWAEWCGPCKQIGPILDQLSKELGDKIDIRKVNIDENPETPTKFGVRGIPTLMIFNEGEVVGTKVGSMPKSSLQDWINETIKEDS